MLIKKDQDTIKSYFEDSSNLKGGYAEKVIFPETLRELSDFLKDAYIKKIPVTISGGGTSTTGSRIPFGGAAISMEKFNKLIEISKDEKYAVTEAGVLVEELKNLSEKEGLFYTCHPTEKTAFVGGTVATNASGSRSFKYGPTRKYINRLKMLLSNGDILEIRRGTKTLTRDNPIIKLDNGREIRIPLPTYRMPDVKNSAGYFAKNNMDLIDLFIGQEGTLSVIVEIEIGLVPKPDNILSAFVFFEKEEDTWGFSRENRLDALSIEYFDSNALRLLGTKNPNIPPGANAAIFFEQEVAKNNRDAAIDVWLKLIKKHNASLDDTWVAMTEAQADKFTEFRHSIPETINDIVKRSGFQKLSTDIAVPDNKFLDMMNFYKDTFKKEKMEHVIFGHIGESHVHVNVIPRGAHELDKAKEICLGFVKKGVSLGGTVSAEHGIGKTRHKYLELMYGKSGILEMAGIKKALDPNCILGLDNIFPKELLNAI